MAADNATVRTSAAKVLVHLLGTVATAIEGALRYARHAGPERSRREAAETREEKGRQVPHHYRRRRSEHEKSRAIQSTAVADADEFWANGR